MRAARVVAITVALAVAIAPASLGAAKQVKTFGIQRIDSKNTAVSEPIEYRLKDSDRDVTVSDIGQWDSWGSQDAVANAGSIETCNGDRSNCTPSSGTISFSDTVTTKCRLKKGKPKRTVKLYGAVLISPMLGSGGGQIFGIDGDPPRCPKF